MPEQPDVPDPTDQDRASADRLVIYFVIGGILLAFCIGFIILVIAAITDWQH